MKHRGKIIFAVLAAALYGISAPASKLLLNYISPLFLAALLYIGAGIGMGTYYTIKKISTDRNTEANLSKKDIPYIVAMIILDVLAPILLLFGLQTTNAGTASLLNNFEIVVTSLIALIFFKEAIGKRQWIAIVLIIAASIVLTINSENTLSFSFGSVLILLACVSWGVENNCTRQLSLKDPVQIVVIKGFGSGTGALIVCAIWGEFTSNVFFILCALILGFVSYGLSILFYVFAQRQLGAARTSIYYSIAPFIGVVISWIILKEIITINFLIALAIMIFATYLMIKEVHRHKHHHDSITHEHKHRHNDQHHEHAHDKTIEGYHTHRHTHNEIDHSHDHYPDEHHRHKH